MCDGKPLQVLVTTDRLKSKYSKPNAPKPDWIGIRVGTDEYSYTTENEKCAVALTGLKGQTVTIIASGREADANIVVMRQGSAVEQPPQHKEQPQQSSQQRQTQEPPPENTGPDPVKAAEVHIARNRVLSAIALRATYTLVKECEEWHRAKYGDAGFMVHPSVVACIYTSQLYGADRNGIPGPNMPFDTGFKPKSEKGGGK